jgi:argininosuccinate lyase
MSGLIQSQEIQGGAVYGVKQMEYTVDGVSGKDYTAALTAAAFRQSVAIEDATASYAEVVRQRQKKVSELAEALAILTDNVATLKTGKDVSNDDWTDSTTAMTKAAEILDKYGISHNIVKVEVLAVLGHDVSRIQRRYAQKTQTNVQYEMDKEDNNLQQDLVTLNSFVSKRDNAYSTASKLVKKAENAASSTISNIGG